MPDHATHAGWSVGESMPLELDSALSLVNGYYPTGSLPAAFESVRQAVPAEWLAEWQAMLNEPGANLALMEMGARLAGMLEEPDYPRATLAIRALTVDGALARLGTLAELPELVPSSTPAERLAAASGDVYGRAYARLGFDAATVARLARGLRRDAARLARVLSGGDLHARFWHWLDRFYYEIYRPWRAGRVDVVERLKGRAALALAAQSSAGLPPDVSWLPAASPLHTIPALAAPVAEGVARVFFWAEPFGLFDTWLAHPEPGGLLLVLSLSERGELWTNFQATAADIASRTHALADPTRLTILRMIRHFGLDNTRIADNLELARPTVSVHARILREAGLIRSREAGRAVHHEIVPSAVRQLFQDLERFLDLPEE